MHREYNCEFCGDVCVTRDKRSKICGKPECLKALARQTYTKKLFAKVCLLCGNDFQGKRQEGLCPNCKGKSAHVPGSRQLATHPYLEQHFCPTCGVLKREVTKLSRYPNKPPVEIRESNCRSCFSYHLSEQRKGENNPQWTGGPSTWARPQYEQTPERKEEVRKKSSERMKKDNPMKSPEVVEKVSDTLRSKYADGTIVPKSGVEHWAWKGDRKRAFRIRASLLRSWGKPLRLAKNNCCELCGDQYGKKEVHHVEESFADILRKFTTEPLDALSEEEFNSVSKNLIEYHINTPVKGQVLCVPCHKKVDPLRR